MAEQIELLPTQLTLEGLLRDALAHLYDSPQLQLHPLTRLLANETSASDHTGLTLHRLILEAMEQLRPLAHVGASDPAWRPYLALHLRYVEGMELQQIAEELGLSLRQLRREHARGLRALALLIWTEFLSPQQRQLLEESPQEPDPFIAAKTETDVEPGVEKQNSESSESHLNRELSRLGTGEPTNTGTSVKVALQGVASTLIDLLERQSVRLLVDLPDETPAVGLDRVVLRQILLNLLIHLLEQTAGGDIHVRVQTDADSLELTLFHPQSLSAPTTLPPSPSGAGDRLSIAEQLLRLQGGQLLWATPEEGEGQSEDQGRIVCRLRLPIHQAPLILVVDDNPDLINLFRRYLADSACRVIGVADSRKALELAQNLRPHAIILDVMMPEQDGWELLQRFKVQPETRAVPVIVCSVLREEALAKSLGASSFVAKPVTQQALKAVLAPLLTPTLAPMESMPPRAKHQDSP